MNDIFTPAPTQGPTFTKSAVKAAIVRTAAMSATALAGFTTWRFFGSKPGTGATAADTAAPHTHGTPPQHATHEAPATEPVEEPIEAPVTDAIAPDEEITADDVMADEVIAADDVMTDETIQEMVDAAIEEAASEAADTEEDFTQDLAEADAESVATEADEAIDDTDIEFTDEDQADFAEMERELEELDAELDDEPGEEPATRGAHRGPVSASNPGESGDLDMSSFSHPSPVAAPAAGTQLPGIERIDYAEVDAHSWIEEHHLTALGFQRLEIRGNVCPVAYFSDENGSRIFMADTDGDGIFDAAYNSAYRLIDTFTSDEDVSLGFMADDIAALIVEQNGADYIPPAGLIDDMMSDFPDTYASAHAFSSNDLHTSSSLTDEADDDSDDRDDDNDNDNYDDNNDGDDYEADYDDRGDNDGRGSDDGYYSDDDGRGDGGYSDDDRDDDSDAADDDSDLWELEF